MSTSTTPVMTFNAVDNVRAAASLAASGTANYDVDYSAVFEAQVHIKNTPGGTISGTRGLKIEIFKRTGSGPTTGSSPFMTYFLPSQTASTAESADIYLSTGKYNIKITNLDTAQAIDVAIGADTLTNLTTA